MSVWSPDEPLRRFEEWPVGFFLAGLAGLRLVLIQKFELSGDEALYWEWSRVLDLSYSTHPPVVAYVIRIFTTFGDSELWVRLGAVLSITGAVLVARAIAGKVFGGGARSLAILLPNFTIGFSVLALLMTPDAPLVFFWIWTILATIHALEGRPGWWWWAGTAFGLACLSKYTAVLLLPCVLGTVLTVPRYRHWLRRPEPYGALGLAALLFSPVLLWNLRHDWLSFRFQFGRRVAEAAGSSAVGWPHTVGEFLAGQAALLTPLIFLLIVWSTAVMAKRAVREQHGPLTLLVWTAAGPFLFFFGWSFFVRIEGNWPAVAYLSAFVLLAGSLAGRHWRYGLALATSAVLVIVVHLQAVIGLLPLPTALDQTVRLTGWRQLSAVTEAHRATMPRAAFLLTPEYQIASRLAFYLPRYETVFLTKTFLPPVEQDPVGDYRGPRVHFWRSRYARPGTDALFIDDEPGRWDMLRPYFEQVEVLPPLEVYRGQQHVRTIYFARCRGLLPASQLIVQQR